MNTKIFQLGVKALILSSDRSRFLALKRNTDKNLSVNEEYDIPGGRIEFGEEPIEGLKREILEEVNYTIKTAPIILDAGNILLTPERHIVRITYLILDDIELDVINLGDEHINADMVNLMPNDGYHPLLNKAIMFAKETSSRRVEV